MGTAITYKEHGYTHLCVSMENNQLDIKGFKSLKAAKKHMGTLQYSKEMLCQVITVNKAVKLGY